MTLDLSKPPFMTRDGTPMHFIGYDMDGDTIWQRPDGKIRSRLACGRLYIHKESTFDIINAPPTKVKETLWANIYPPGGAMWRGYLHATRELAEANASPAAIATVPVEVEYTPKEPK